MPDDCAPSRQDTPEAPCRLNDRFLRFSRRRSDTPARSGSRVGSTSGSSSGTSGSGTGGWGSGFLGSGSGGGTLGSSITRVFPPFHRTTAPEGPNRKSAIAGIHFHQQGRRTGISLRRPGSVCPGQLTGVPCWQPFASTMVKFPERGLSSTAALRRVSSEERKKSSS